MNVSITITLLITGIIAIGLLFFAMQIIFKKNKIENEEGITKKSFAIWCGLLFFSYCMILSTVLETLKEALIIYTNSTVDFGIELKTTCIFLGISFAWFSILYSITNILSKLIFQDRKNDIEIANDNFGYFLLKGLFILGSSIALLPVLETILKQFLPIIQTPFYH